jgi:hypothetical protein
MSPQHNAAPEDCPMLDAAPPVPALSNQPWFWPLAFSVALGILTGGVYVGTAGKSDQTATIMIGELKAADASLAAKIEALVAERQRDVERLVRVEVQNQAVQDSLKEIKDGLAVLLRKYHADPTPR